MTQNLEDVKIQPEGVVRSFAEIQNIFRLLEQEVAQTAGTPPNIAMPVDDNPLVRMDFMKQSIDSDRTRMDDIGEVARGTATGLGAVWKSGCVHQVVDCGNPFAPCSDPGPPTHPRERLQGRSMIGAEVPHTPEGCPYPPVLQWGHGQSVGSVAFHGHDLDPAGVPQDSHPGYQTGEARNGARGTP